jgi:translation initiation factor 6
MENRFRFVRMDFNSDPNIGMFGFATDTYCLLGMSLSKKVIDKLEQVLQVKVKTAQIFSTELIGLFCSGNDHGIVLTKMAEPEEIEQIKSLFPKLNILVTPTDITATGNMILCNNNGAIISPLLEKYKDKISKCLNCPVEISQIGDLDVVGSAGIASSKGCLLHREATDEQVELIEKILKVQTDVGTVGKGNPYIKSGIIVNSNGVIVSEESTGPELGRIGELFE